MPNFQLSFHTSRGSVHLKASKYPPPDKDKEGFCKNTSLKKVKEKYKCKLSFKNALWKLIPCCPRLPVPLLIEFVVNTTMTEGLSFFQLKPLYPLSPFLLAPVI